MAGNRIKIGNVEVVSLSDKRAEYPWTNVFPDVPAEAWAPFRQRYPDLFTAEGNWHNNLGCFVVASQGRLVLVDTGIGLAAGGQLLGALGQEGVRPEVINVVVHTHLHPDHVGWNLSDGNPTFPQARHLVHRADWDFFGSEENQKNFNLAWIAGTVTPLQASGKLDLVGSDHKVTDEVSTVHTPGHTPGHMSLLIASGNERGVILGDVANVPPQVTETEWCASFDGHADTARKTRREFLDRMEQENRVIGAGHFPPPSFGRLVRFEGKRYWQGL